MQDKLSQLHHLRNLDLSLATREECSELIYQFGIGYITKPGSQYYHSAFRVRRNDQPLFNHKSELWTREPGTGPAGRFNALGEPVLYLSSTPYGALWEMRPKAGERYTIVACSQQAGSPLLTIMVIGAERFLPTSATGPLADHMLNGVRGAPGFMDELRRRGIEQQWLLQDDFFADIATLWIPPGEPSDHYKLTIPLWGCFVRGSAKLQGLMYPSVQHNRHAFNVALKSEAAGSIKPKEVWVIDVRAVDRYIDPREGDVIGRVTWRGHFRDDDTIDWSEGDWSLEQVRQEFLKEIGPAPVIPEAPRMLKYSEREVKIRFGSYNWGR